MIDHLKGLGNLASLKLIRSDITRFILFTTCMAISSITQAADLTFKTECVGSYSIDLPDNIEVALFPTNKFLEPKTRFPVYFSDGKWAILSTFNYNHNDLSITANWTDTELVKVKKMMHTTNQKIKKDNPEDLVELWNKKNNFGFYAKAASRVTFAENNKIYSFYSDEHYQGKERDFDFYKQNATAIINGFSTRNLFEVPQIAGKCLPYSFVAGDDSSTPINLTVSFRLNEHPDIVISFTENTRSFTNSLNNHAKDEFNDFWNNNYDINNYNIENIKLLGFPKYKKIRMDGRQGVAGLVEIKYQDKSPSDYGYYSVVDDDSRNTESSKKNHPWLIMSVIGNQSESKGKTPLTKDEIYELAKKIEASIKRRATEQ